MAPPITSQQALAALHPGLARLVVERGWRELRPVQLGALPVILDGTDCVIEAPTAGGKTEAVLFPLLTRASEASARGVRILYLAPLRALLNNVELRGREYADACRLSAFKWHGDVDQQEKIDAFRDAPDLLMTTPESLEAMLLRRAGWQDFFRELMAVVIDEAHNFAAGDRGGHLLCLLERVEETVTAPPQRIALSATVGNPDGMLDWLAGSRRSRGRRVEIRAEAPPPRDFRVLHFDEDRDTEATPAPQRAEYRRFRELHHILSTGVAGRSSRSLVFVRSRKGTEALAEAFKTSSPETAGRPGLRIRTHHSAVSKFFREEAEDLIQKASEDGLNAILSTSTLELGIDIGELDHVVQMDALASPSSFLQRVGRTGRRAGKPQFFRGLTVKNEHLPVLAATVSLGLAGRSEELLLPRRAFHLLAHQLLCLALQGFGVEPDRAWEQLRGAHCFADVARHELDELVQHMVATGYLRRTDGLLLAGPAAEKLYLHTNWRRLFAVFDSAPLYEVIHRRHPVGTLDAKFVESLKTPFFFVLAGKLWRADHVDPDRRRVTSSPSKTGQAPAWVSFGGPGVPFETAQEVGRLLHADAPPAFLNGEGRASFAFLQQQAASDDWSPGGSVVHATRANQLELVTFAGDRINRTLARLFASRGVDSAVADYRAVHLKAKPSTKPPLADLARTVLAELRSSGLEALPSLLGSLETVQPLWPFSPFARCLPPSLWAAALVEQNLDAEGLIRWLSTGSRSSSKLPHGTEETDAP